MFLFRFFFKATVFFLFWGVLIAAGLFAYIFATYGRDLPTVSFMKDYAPPTVSRIHASDGQLIAEHSVERRLFVPFEALPEHVVGAFLSAEDKDFFQHGGIDYISLGGAILNNLKRARDNRSFVGASTITQQVAKNFVTGGRRSIERKIREAFIAWKLETEFTKEEIFELYVNEVEFGQRAFGIAAAALTYFNKSVKELNIQEAAYLAATLKGPSNYHPERHRDRAKERRDWVIDQMFDNGYVESEVGVILAKSDYVQPDWSYRADTLNVPYFSAEVKRQLDRDFGSQQVMEEGLSVRSTLDPAVQDMAERNLRKGLLRYDRRHGWRGPLGEVSLYAENWQELLVKFEDTPGLRKWMPALVYEQDRDEARILFADGSDGRIPLDNMRWARPWVEEQKLGPSVKRTSDVVKPGYVVAVSADDPADKRWTLEQIPDVQGAIVALDPHTGRIHALVGGYDHKLSQFNRATQALRQPGSTIKPFVYLAGLDSGMTPDTKLMDSPVVVRMDNGEIYKPKNSDGRFLGEQPLKVGLEKSRNLMTLRLAQDIGMDKVVDYARDFGIDEEMRPLLSMALGSGGTSLLNMTGAYAMLANGGKHVRPTLIDRVQDRKGQTVRRVDVSECPTCRSDDLMSGERLPILIDKRKQVGDPENIYHIVSMLQAVVQRGTARKIGATLNRPVAGKTGTTNKNHDAWFVGFTPNLVIGVWVGFDKPRTLGKSEYGGRAAAPIFRDLLNEMLADVEPEVFKVPDGITYKHIDPISGAIKQEDTQVAQVEDKRPATVRKIRPAGAPETQPQPQQELQPYDPYAQVQQQNAGNLSFGAAPVTRGAIDIQPVQQQPVPQQQPASGSLGGIY